MKHILLANILILSVTLFCITILVYKYIQAERKLAKHGESELFKNENNED